jgi:hypothetical protein
MLGSVAAHSVRGTRRRRQAGANPRSFSRAATASFGSSGQYQMVGDLRPTVGMTNLRFRQNKEKQDRLGAPAMRLEGNRIHQRTSSRASRRSTGQRRGRYVPSALPRSIFTACPDGIVQWPPATIGPVEKQPTIV